MQLRAAYGWCVTSSAVFVSALLSRETNATNWQEMCSLTSVHQCFFLFPSLIEVREGPWAFFPPVSLFITWTALFLCRVIPPPPQAICTHVTLHFSSYMFITAIQVNSSGLVWQSVHEVSQDTGRTQHPTPACPIPLKSSGVPCAIGRASGEPKHCG